MKHVASHQQQQGFTLVELSIVFMLLIIGIAGTIAVAQYTVRMEQGRSVATHMLQLDDAVIRYKEKFAAQLRQLPDACGQSTYTVGTPLTLLQSGCELEVPIELPDPSSPGTVLKFTINIDNGMQPSIENLKALRLLESGFSGTLKLTIDSTQHVTRSSLFSGQQQSDGLDNYVILITKCQGTNCNLGDPANPALISYVFNPQPYLIDQKLFGSGPRLGTAVSAMKGRGFLSQKGGDGRLSNHLGQLVLDNPVSTGTSGAIGILATYDRGLGSAESQKYTLRDGSQKPTSDWDFNNKALTNVSNLETTGNIKTAGNITVAGNNTVAGNLSVDGDSTFKKDVTNKGKTSLDKTQMAQKANVGDVCSTSMESFATNAANSAKLLICNDGKWSDWSTVVASNPPVTNPPVTNPPVTNPPVTNPPVTNPPVTNPPVTNPPVTNPPVTNPPVTNPPVTNPPVTNPDAIGEIWIGAEVTVIKTGDASTDAYNASQLSSNNFSFKASYYKFDSMTGNSILKQININLKPGDCKVYRISNVDSNQKLDVKFDDVDREWLNRPIFSYVAKPASKSYSKSAWDALYSVPISYSGFGSMYSYRKGSFSTPSCTQNAVDH
jgi:hypothetical protein